MQQHMIDAYRAAQRGESAPPLPGAGDVRTLRAARDWWRFRTVVTAPADRLPARVLRAVRSALGIRTAATGGQGRAVPEAAHRAGAPAGPAASAPGGRRDARQEVREGGPHVGGRPAQCR